MSNKLAKNPCGSCPYRKDVPSGVWAEEEYNKLYDYDNDTPYQPPTAFFCHQQNEKLCSGWVGCHDMNNSLGLRMAVSVGLLNSNDYDAALDYKSSVPLFNSGTAAAEHGKLEIKNPNNRAIKIVNKLTKKKARIVRN